MANYDDPNRRPRTTRAVDAETVAKEVDILGESPSGLAWKVYILELDIVRWLPKSQCEIYERNLSQYASIPKWLWDKFKTVEPDE